MDQRLAVSKNATPDRSWIGYRAKADHVLKRLERGELGGRYNNDPLVPQDGEWIQLGRMYNVGAKLLVYMVENNMLVRRGQNTTVSGFLDDWYRVADRYFPPEPDAELRDVVIRLSKQAMRLAEETAHLIEHNKRLIVLFEAVASGLNRVVFTNRELP